MGSSYAKLAALDDDEEKAKGSGYKRLAALDEDETTSSASTSPSPADSPQQRTLEQEFGRQLGLTGRAVAQGLASMPLAAMDAGVATRNLLTGENYDMPSKMWNESLDAAFPKPQTNVEKVSQFVGSVVAGSRIPAPQVRAPAPSSFAAGPASTTSQVLSQSQDAGYVVPPATASPTVLSKVAEGIAGKAATAQAASVKNQKVTNDLARKALGLSEDAPLNPQTLKSVRDEAGKVYEQVKNAGEIKTDTQYLDDLISLGRSADDIAKDFPGADVGATEQISKLVDSLLQNKFDSKSALQYLKELRKQSSGNLSGVNFADPSKQALGMAQREAAVILEEQIQRHLVSNGMEDVANNFANARRTIAISHSVENAMNETTGNVVAGKLGQQLAKGKPLSGELETIARFGRAFPKAAKEVTESMPGISPMDFYAAGGLSVLSQNPAALMMPLARVATRSALLSPQVQSRLGQAPASVGPADINLGMAPSTFIQVPSVWQQSGEEQQ